MGTRPRRRGALPIAALARGLAARPTTPHRLRRRVHGMSNRLTFQRHGTGMDVVVSCTAQRPVSTPNSNV
ncbi:hypothetical protein [Streptomyces sp. BRA346]|uniref:hypothetical protein n=1 Tax=Streptomyces sp. BRA346 TaxID=2878199 RepID=UPI0040648760